jgi:hypothetical protein
MTRVSIEPATLPPTVAQQIFIIGTGIAAGVTGLVLARKFVGVQRVPTPALIVATVVSALATFGAGLYLASTREV